MGHGILSPGRLPIPPLELMKFLIIILLKISIVNTFFAFYAPELIIALKEYINFTDSVIRMLYNIKEYSLGAVFMKYELAENIKKLRLQKHFTQTELGKRIGVTTSTVASYESQDRLPSIAVLIKLSAELNVSIEYLLGINKNKTLDVSEVSDKQISALNVIIDQFKEDNKR